MATNSVGSGRTYTTLASWLAACPANLVTATDTWIGELYTGVHTESGTVTVPAITVNSTYYIELRAASGNSFYDHANVRTNALRYNSSNGAALRWTDGYSAGLVCTTVPRRIRLTGLMVLFDATNNSNVALLHGIIDVNRCILESRKTGGSVIDNRTETRSYLRNSVVAFRSNSGTLTAVQGDVDMLNVTVQRIGTASGTGVTGSYSSYPSCRNVWVGGFTTQFGGTLGNYGTSSYNASTVASGSIPGTNNTGSLTAASQFENLTEGTHDLRLAAGAGLIGIGNTDATNAPNDISGFTRGTGTAGDIGAWEYGSAAAGPSRHAVERGRSVARGILRGV